MEMSEAIRNVCDMKDPLCAQGVEHVLRKIPGVHHVQTNPINGTTVVHFDQDVTDLKTLKAAVADCGLACNVTSLSHNGRARRATRAAHAVTTMDHAAHTGHEDVEVAMLTGDNRGTAERVAAELGISTVFAEVLPDQKQDKVKELQARGHKVGMVGDGINDAPALAQADVGIAIGAGTDVAVETADVVLMKSEPFDAVRMLELSKATLRKMRQNLGWATGYNLAAIPIAAGLFAPVGITLRPEIGALAMSGSSIIVAANAILLKRARLSEIN
jgi:Cu2+-exporting ATPase